MKLKITLVSLGLLLGITAVSAYVMISASLDLMAARRVLTGGALRMEAPPLDEARAHLQGAESRFESLPARLVGWLPVVRQNFSAIRSVAEGTLGLLEPAEEMHGAIEGLEAGGLVSEGSFNLTLLGGLEVPLRNEVEALSELAATIERHRNGWLAPPLWSVMDDLLDQVEELETSTSAAAEMVGLAPSLLGATEERTYLVALLNNTELRGGGGILSGVGSLSVRDGRISLNRFQYYKQLADPPPYRRVPAPTDFKKRFSSYSADTTRWVTTSSSPDMPDVALVASRLFELVKGVETDGVIFIDPRGLAAMLPPGASIDVPNTNTSVTAADLPDYVYRGAYAELGRASDRRRDSLIGLGEAAVRVILDRGFKGMGRFRSMGAAVAGGHISFVSLHQDEERALADAGIARDLGDPEGDAVLATVQNIGGNKFDSYAQRSIDHACRVEPDTPTRCRTVVGIQNRTPRGLPFGDPDEPYALFKNVVEIHVPSEAELLAVNSGGSPVDYFTEREDGFTAVGLPVELPRGRELSISVSYELPPSDEYVLEILPQPLVEDARLEVEVEFPDHWAVEGPEDSQRNGAFTWAGELDRTLVFEARPDERTGWASLWAGVSRLW
ncbi:MAG: DUF4012 domain-containing protein [Actinomycetota bacterium]